MVAGTPLFICTLVVTALLGSCTRPIEGAPCPCSSGNECCDGVCVKEGACSLSDDAGPDGGQTTPPTTRDAGTDAALEGEAGTPDAPDHVAPGELGKLPRHCSPDGWCGDPHPFRAVFGLAANDVWAVSADDAERQTFQHWDGTRWHNVRNEQLRDETVVHAIHGRGKDVWFAGNNGRLGMALRFDGKTFHHYYAVDDTSDFRALWVMGERDVWVAGAPNSLARWDGESFHKDSSLEAEINALWGSGPDDLWAVGSTGTIAHWDGKVWARHGQALGVATRANLWSVWGSSAQSIWAVGSDRTLLHWNGRRWTELDLSMLLTSTVGLQAVHGRAEDDVWVATSEGRLLHFDGKRWRKLDDVRATGSLRGLWSAPEGELWAVGADAAALHWDGQSWVGSERAVAADMLDVWGVGKRVWAVGSAGTILHGNGKVWRALSSGTKGSLRAVHGTGEHDVWAVGEEILHWDGESWKQAYDDDAQLYGVWAVTANDVWAVGDDANGGVVFRLSEGRWQVHQRFPGRKLRKVWARVPTDVWVQYEKDGGLRWNGESWQELPLPERDVIYTPVAQALAGTRSEGVWLVQIINRLPYLSIEFSKYSAGRWKLLHDELEFDHRLGGVHMVEPGKIYVVGDGIWKFDGDEVSLSARRSEGMLHDIWGTREDDLWAVGTRGTILHREPSMTVASVAPAASPCGDVQSSPEHCGSCNILCDDGDSPLVSCEMGSCREVRVVSGEPAYTEPQGNWEGGDEYFFPCGYDSVMLGLIGQTGLGSTISVGARCGRIELSTGPEGYSVSVKATFDEAPPDHDLPSLDPDTAWNSEWYTLDCPENAVLTGLSGATHMLKDSDEAPTVGKLGIQCSTVGVEGLQLVLTPIPGFEEVGKINASLSTFEQRCEDPSAVITGVWGTSGWFLDSAGLECSAMTIEKTTGRSLLTDYPRDTGHLPDL
jgi:hypothetical protein